MRRRGTTTGPAGCLAGLLCLLALALPAAAQKAAPPHAPTSIVKNVNEVNLVFSAVDGHHHFVPGLRANQIRILDKGKLQRILRFDSQGNLPLHIALLVDTSSSVRDRFKFEQEAAIEFIESVLRQGKDQAMVVAFDSSIQVMQDFTDDEEAISRAIHGLRPGGGTALYDAIYATAHDKMLNDNTQVRNVMVVISDGDDDQSRMSAGDAVDMAQRAGAIIYTIGTDPTGSFPRDDKLMRNFSSQTGGRSFFPFRAPQLGRAFASITDELRHQYIVSYQPNNFVPNGTFHRVEIRILKKDVHARARSGYYAQAASSATAGPPGGS